MADKRIGSYRVVSTLGEGSAGEVYVVEDPSFGGRLVVKLLHQRLGKAEADGHPSPAGVLLRTLRQAENLLHPGICKLFESAHVAEERPFYVSEHLGTESLFARLLARGGALPPSEALSLFADLAQTLSVAHAAGLVHGDLHGGNVFLVPVVSSPGGFERARITDFGVAHAAAEWHRTGAAVEGRPGNKFPLQLPPEQRRDPSKLSNKGDVYSLGALLYRTLTSEVPPVLEGSPAEHALLPKGLKRFLGKMLDREPGARPEMAEVAAELRSLLPSRIGAYLIENRIEDDGEWSQSEVLHRLTQERGHLWKHQNLDGDELRSGFFEAAKWVQKLDLPGFPKVLETGEAKEERRPDDSFSYVITRCPQGETLAERVRRRGRLAHDGVALARQVADQLAAAHAQGVCHLSLTPERILVSESANQKPSAELTLPRTLRLFSKEAAPAQPGSSPRLRDIDLALAPYLSPEQVRGDHTLNDRADVYALGVILYEILSGQPPFFGTDATAIAMAHLQTQPRSLRDQEPGVPPDLADLVQRMLAKDPQNRPDMAAVAIELYQSTFADAILKLASSGKGFAANLLAGVRDAYKVAPESLIYGLLGGIWFQGLQGSAPGSPALTEAGQHLLGVLGALFSLHREPVLNDVQVRMLSAVRQLLELCTAPQRDALAPILSPALGHPVFPRGTFPKEMITIASRTKQEPGPFPVLPFSPKRFEELYRYSGPQLAVLDAYTRWSEQNRVHSWTAQTGYNPCDLHVIADATEKCNLLQLTMTGGPKYKVGVLGMQPPVDLQGVSAIVLDVFSSLWPQCYVALLFHTKDGKAYESRPLAVAGAPGAAAGGGVWTRNLRFPLYLGDFKSDQSQVPWRSYDVRFDPRSAVDQIVILVYNYTESGVVRIGPLRAERK